MSNLWYTLPYYLQRDSTRNTAVVHAYVHPKQRNRKDYHTKNGKKRPKRAQKGKKGKKRRGNEKKGKEWKEGKKKTNPKSSRMPSERRPSPEGTRLLFEGSISPMIYMPR